MNILLAEDDERLGKMVAHLLKKEFYHVDWVKNGKDALSYSLLTNYDMIILDWMMPGMDGLTVCKKLRSRGVKSGIMFVTAKDGISDVINGLDSGADDYIVKPFEIGEMLARIRAICRRKEKSLEESICIQDFTLNLNSHTLMHKGKVIDLTKKEYQIVEILFRNCNQIVTREVLFERIWGLDTDVSDNALDALIKLVRKKIDLVKGPSLIQNVRGIGYKVRNHNVS